MTDTDSFRPKARRPRGFADRRGAPLAHERAIAETVLGVYQAWGFERLDTSAFEYADALGKFLPDQDRPNEGVFAIQDDDEQWMALRYDLTAPLARFVAEHYEALPKPYRRCAAGPVWRNEKPGPGRFREFWQCDADTVGSASPAADAEIIAMGVEAFTKLGLGEGAFTFKISTRLALDSVLEGIGLSGDTQGIARARLTALRAIDKMDRLGTAGVRLLLGPGRRDDSGDFTAGAGLEAEAIDRIIGFIEAGAGSRAATLNNLSPMLDRNAKGAQALAELTAIDAVLSRLGVTAIAAQFEPAVVRGLEYYTGAVFEAELLTTVTDEAGQTVRFGSVGGGGRYDDLVSRFKGQPIPATGISVGVSRLAAALAASNAKEDKARGPVVILAFDQAELGTYFAMAAELRAAGLPTEVYLGGSGPKAQFKYADKRAAPVAVICGGDEMARGEVSLKDLQAGALVGTSASDREAYQAARGDVQVTVPRAALVDAVKAILARQGATE
jgi:histidyl-tRNA synthetase